MSAPVRDGTGQCVGCSPKIVLPDTSDGIHASDFSSCTNQLDSHVRPNLNNRVFVIGKLRRSSIGVKLDIGRDQLARVSAWIGSTPKSYILT